MENKSNIEKKPEQQKSFFHKTDYISIIFLLLFGLIIIVMITANIYFGEVTKNNYTNELNNSLDKGILECVYEESMYLNYISEKNRCKNALYYSYVSPESDNTYLLATLQNIENMQESSYYMNICKTFCKNNESTCEDNDRYNNCINELEPPSGCNLPVPLAIEEETTKLLYPFDNGINKKC